MTNWSAVLWGFLVGIVIAFVFALDSAVGGALGALVSSARNDRTRRPVEE